MDIALELPPPMNGSHDHAVATLKCFIIPMCSNALSLFLPAIAWELGNIFSRPTGPPDINQIHILQVMVVARKK